ncbi:hypothetical protein EU519_00495 [Candidatus Thorarchaeota archaeon]|nr:MAG: hypothetical protein EU519_00495 [Candidatus Thorarchaeota archaeon]
MRAEIRLYLRSEEDAEVVLSSIDPDNTPLPDGLLIKTQREERELVFLVDCDRGMSSFMATIEDLMSAVDVSVRMAETVTNKTR